MKVALCHESKECIEKLTGMISNISDKHTLNIVVLYFDSPQKLFWYFSDNKDLELIFVNAKNIWLSQIHRIREYCRRVKIIILASSLEEMIPAFYIANANSFMLKSFVSQNFKAHLENLISQIEEECLEEFFIEKNDLGTYKIFLKDIRFIETYDRNTLIHTTQNTVLSYKTMKQHEANFGSTFFRVHESFLVNMQYVRAIVKNNIVLNDSQIIPCSKYRKNNFVLTLSQYWKKDKIEIKPKSW